jgi:hypothetical protein
MPSRLRYGLLLCITAITLTFVQVESGHGAYFIEYIYDNAGNLVERRMTLDDVGPTGTVLINSGAAYTNSRWVTLTLTCSDAVSGCSEMQFKNDGSTYSSPEPYAATKPWTLAAADGTRVLYVKFKDKAGNWSAPYTDTIVLDTVAPTGMIAINGGLAYANSTSVTLNLTCNDPLSGCSQMQFSNDGTTYSSPEAFSTSKAWTLTTGDGTKTVYAKFKDGAGNWSTAYNDTIVLETVLPTGTITIDGGHAYANSTTVTLTLTCSDAGSGCSQMKFSNDGANYSAPEGYSTSKVWSLLTGDGPKTVYAQFKDGAGNWSTAYTDTITLDTTPPVRIGGSSYGTIQAAYNVAVSGNTIKCRDSILIQSLTVGRNITVSLEGGYNAGFTNNYGTMTTLKGMLTTTTGGGTITIENFTLAQ